MESIVSKELLLRAGSRRRALERAFGFEAHTGARLGDPPGEDSGTFRLVHELERRGIPAVGPIWDS